VQRESGSTNARRILRWPRSDAAIANALESFLPRVLPRATEWLFFNEMVRDALAHRRCACSSRIFQKELRSLVEPSARMANARGIMRFEPSERSIDLWFPSAEVSLFGESAKERLRGETRRERKRVDLVDFANLSGLSIDDSWKRYVAC